MSNGVPFAELIATVELDTSKLDRSVAALDKKLDGIAQSLGRMEGKTKGAGKGLDDAAMSGNKFSGALGLLESKFAGSSAAAGQFSSLISGLGVGGGPFALAATGALAVGAAVFALGNHSADAAAEMHDLSLSTGVSVETLSAFRLVARQAGLSMEEFGSSIEKFDKLIGEAANGSDSAREKLMRFGIDPIQALNDQEGALAKVFKRINDLPEGIQRVTAAQEAFGRGGAKMVDVIQSAGGNFDEFMRKARAAGLVISGETAAAADDFKDKLDALSFRLEEVARRIGTPLIPRLHALADQLDRTLAGTTDDADLWGPVVAGAFDTAAQHADNYLKILKEISNLGPLSRLKDGANLAGSYLIAPGAGFANAAPKGQTATVADAAPTEDQRALLNQMTGLLAQANQLVQEKLIGSFTADAQKEIESLQSGLRTFGDSTKVGAVTEMFRKMRENAEKIPEVFRGGVLAELDSFKAKAISIARAWDEQESSLKRGREALHTAEQAADAYNKTIAAMNDATELESITKQFGFGANEAREQFKLMHGEYKALIDESTKEGQQYASNLLAVARRRDVDEQIKTVSEGINSALAEQVTHLGMVLSLAAQIERKFQGSKAPEVVQWEIERLKALGLAADIKKRHEDFQLTAPTLPGFENFKAPTKMPAIDPHVGDVVRPTWERIGDYVKDNSGELARDVTGIWQGSLNELYQNGVQGFLLSLGSGFLNIAEQIANDYITGIIGGALKRLGESMSKGGGGGILGTILGFLGIAAGAAAGGGANLPASHALPFTQLAPFATGGMVSGPGTSTSDSIRAALSDGEYVMNAQAVDRYGPAFMQSVNQGSYNPAAQGGAQDNSRTVQIGQVHFHYHGQQQQQARGGSQPSARQHANDLARFLLTSDVFRSM